jgi:hypothetical protein
VEDSTGVKSSRRPRHTKGCSVKEEEENDFLRHEY